MNTYPIKCTISTMLVVGIGVGLFLESRENAAYSIGKEHIHDDRPLATMEYRYNVASVTGTTVSGDYRPDFNSGLTYFV
ncbi:MAG: hypothetical protein V1853_05380 [bacterium]